VSFSRILIAVDGSTRSFDAARAGFDLAAELSAQVATIHVFEPPVPYSGEIGLPADELLQVANSDDENVAEALGRSVHVPEGTTHMVRIGQPADVIVQAAKDWPADLIVIGSHGRSGFGRVLLGSVAESVAREAPCPVLVVRKDHRQAK
jgi:nucleotide-binding universal stress UspA family protein